MAAMNRVLLIGRLEKSPRPIERPSGVEGFRLLLVVKTPGCGVLRIDVEIFGHEARCCLPFSQGDQIHVEGRLAHDDADRDRGRRERHYVLATSACKVGSPFSRWGKSWKKY